MRSTLTIALTGRYFSWGGGIELLRLIANGLLTKQETHKLKIFLLLPVHNKVETPLDALRVVKRSIEGTISHRSPWFPLTAPAYHEGFLDFFQHTRDGGAEICYYDNSPAGLLRCLRRIGADVALPVNGSLGADFPVPWIGYASDFQHKYLPENFTPSECLNRDIHFATMLRDASVAIVNSRAVQSDIFSFFPYAGTKVCALPFSPNPMHEWFEELPFDVREKYSLPDRFFLISNQFWIHKDHLTAFRALRSVESHIVCTGSMEDYRRPHYREEIERFLADHSLTGRVRLLGHIPKRDQIEIMKRSLAVLQPTLFEGGPGGGAVYDAVSLGVPAIVSDIPVNREVEAEGVRFFRAGDSDDLAEKMRHLLAKETNRPSQERLMAMGQANLEKLGDSLLEAVQLVLG